MFEKHSSVWISLSYWMAVLKMHSNFPKKSTPRNYQGKYFKLLLQYHCIMVWKLMCYPNFATNAQDLCAVLWTFIIAENLYQYLRILHYRAGLTFIPSSAYSLICSRFILLNKINLGNELFTLCYCLFVTYWCNVYSAYSRSVTWFWNDTMRRFVKYGDRRVALKTKFCWSHGSWSSVNVLYLAIKL